MMNKFLMTFLLMPLMALADVAWVNGVAWTYRVSAHLYGLSSIGDGVNAAIPQTTRGQIVIPEILGGKYVTYIDDNAFRDCVNITAVIFPTNTYDIGTMAFQGCSALRSVEIPAKVEWIGGSPFHGCRSLASIDVAVGNGRYLSDEGVLIDLKKKSVFCCPEGKSGNYVISSSVTCIGDWAFSHCKSLSSVLIPLGVTSIGSYAFYDCSGLTSVTIPSSVTSIGYDAFHGCRELTSITIPVGLTCIANGAFYGSGLRSVTIPESVKSIGREAFYGCGELESVIIPEGVTNIDYDAFYYCSKLKSVVIPESVIRIDGSAFDACEGLTVVFVPNEPQECVKNCFGDQMWYQRIGTPIDYIWDSQIKGDVAMVCGVRPAFGNVDIPSFIDGVPVTSIADFAFDNCNGLTSITIPEGVMTIGREAFCGCKGLASVVIPSSVTEIGIYAFARCGDLTSITIPSGVTNIGPYVFENCRGLTSVVIPEGVTSIGSYAFSGCNSMTQITIPSSVTYIGYYAFAGCSSLKSIVVPWGLDIGNASVPATAKVIRSIFVVASGRDDEYAYDGSGKRFGVELRSNADGYDVKNVTNTLSVSGAAVGTYRQNLSAEMFFNKNSNFEVAFAVDSNNGASTVKILPRSVEVIAGSKSKTYDGTPLSYDFAEIKGGGFVGNDCKVSAVGSRTSVGTSKNTAVLKWAQDTLKANYSVVTKEGTLTVLPAKVAKSGTEPGSGSVPSGGISKFDGAPVKYDGKGHTINVAALERVTLVGDTPKFSYSLTKDGVYRSEPYCFTNACVASVWYKISAPNYEDYVHEARVTILPREVTLTSGSASKNFDGTALRCESITAGGDGFVAGEGVNAVYTGSQLWPGTSENTFSYTFKKGTLGSNYKVTMAKGKLTVKAVGRVVMDASVTAIPANVFKNCSELTEIVLPSNVTNIAANAFAGCAKLTKVAFPSGLEVTREKLRGWGLTDAVLDDYVEGDFIIVNTSLLGYVGAADVAELVIPEGIELIDEYALSELDDLERVVLPETVKYIGKGAFANDTYLDEVVLPDSVEVIGEGAFENCSWMQTMTMGAGVKSCGDRAFAGCTKLAAAKFAEGLGEVGDAAFSNCWRMMSVSLPASVSNVAATAFSGCTSLTGVTVPTHGGKMSEWFAPVYGQIKNVTVPRDETEIRTDMFAGCSALQTVDLPNGITNIGARAFQNCRNLTEVALPRALVSVGERAFAGCSSLRALGFPENVRQIGVAVCSGCSSLADLSLSKKLTEIPDYAFENCSSLDSFVVPAAVTRLGKRFCPYYTTAIYYLGDAPAYDADAYGAVCGGLTSYVIYGTKGWDRRPTSRDLPQSWLGHGITTWEAVRYDVAFDANGGIFAPVSSATYACEQIVSTGYSLPPFEPTRKGYKFNGYWTQEVGGARVTPSTVVTALKAHALYAQWQAGTTVEIRFNATGGTVQPEQDIYTVEEPYGSLPVPTREHYEFVGWYTEASGGTRIVEASEVPKADRELFAHWAPCRYTIRFHANNGTDATVDQSFTYGETVALRANSFSCSGCTFAGWALNPGGSAVYADKKTLQEVANIEDGMIHLWACWVGNTYVVRFDSHGGEGVIPNQTFVIGVAQPLTKNAFVREGFQFGGWAQTTDSDARYSDGETVKNLTTGKGETVVLYAVWVRTSGKSRVTFEANGGEVLVSQDKRSSGEAFGALPVPTRIGYAFSHWALRDGTKVSADSVVPTTDVTLYAVWTPNRYVVRFNANGGEGKMADQAFLYDAPQKLTLNLYSSVEVG